MYRLKDLIHINRRFQSSVNIQLDLGIEEKINNYIPSQSSLVVLRRLLEAVVEDNAEKAVAISIALLVIRCFTEKNSTCFEENRSSG